MPNVPANRRAPTLAQLRVLRILASGGNIFRNPKTALGRHGSKEPEFYTDNYDMIRPNTIGLLLRKNWVTIADGKVRLTEIGRAAGSSK